MLVDSVGHMGFTADDLSCLLGQVRHHFPGHSLSDKLVESCSVER
jgi:hypothetical protein